MLNIFCFANLQAHENISIRCLVNHIYVVTVFRTIDPQWRSNFGLRRIFNK